MTSDHLQVRISDLLSIADPAIRWIIIKKALAADAMRDNTKPIEAAYRDLDRAELHLRRIAEESSEFLFLPADKEPFDEADKVSGSPQLLDYARRLDKTPKRSRTKPKRDDREINVDDEVAGVDGVLDRSEIIVVEALGEEPAVAADDDEELAPVAEIGEATEPEVPSDESEAIGDVAVEASAPVVEEMPAPVDEHRIATRRLRRSPRRRATASQAEAVVEAESGAVEVPSKVEAQPETAVQREEEEASFSIDLDRVLAVENRRARWVLLKKLVAHVSKRRHVRSVDAAFLESEETAVAVLRAAGGSFSIARGQEPSDMSDYSRKAISLEAFATTGDWEGVSIPLPPSMQRQRERDALRRKQEASRRRSETSPVAEPPSEAVAPPSPESHPDAAAMDSSPSGGEDEEKIAIPEETPVDAATEGEVGSLYPDMADIEAANDRWLEELRSRGSNVSVSAEWLARRLETEAARLRMRAANGL